MSSGSSISTGRHPSALIRVDSVRLEDNLLYCTFTKKCLPSIWINLSNATSDQLTFNFFFPASLRSRQPEGHLLTVLRTVLYEKVLGAVSTSALRSGSALWMDSPSKAQAWLCPCLLPNKIAARSWWCSSNRVACLVAGIRHVQTGKR